jgi:hypothetical protein
MGQTTCYFSMVAEANDAHRGIGHQTGNCQQQHDSYQLQVTPLMRLICRSPRYDSICHVSCAIGFSRGRIRIPIHDLLACKLAIVPPACLSSRHHGMTCTSIKRHLFVLKTSYSRFLLPLLKSFDPFSSFDHVDTIDFIRAHGMFISTCPWSGHRL